MTKHKLKSPPHGEGDEIKPRPEHNDLSYAVNTTEGHLYPEMYCMSIQRFGANVEDCSTVNGPIYFIQQIFMCTHP